MKSTQLADKLRRIGNKRAWCKAHLLSERTLWRILSATANPTAATMAAFAAALSARK
jgi:DNA-binding phage protein